MRPTRLLAALLLVLVGLVWIGQGLGLIGGSFMSDVPLYALLGAILVVAGVAIAVRERQVASRP